MLNYEEFVKQFLKYYNMGFSTTEICSFLNENRSRGYKLLKKLNLSSHKPIGNVVNKEDVDKIASLYLSGKTIEEISEETGIKDGTINYWVRKLEIARPNGKVPDCDQTYFEEIDTPNKAYFLGLLFADGGYLKHNRKSGNYNLTLSLELKKEDSYILEEFKKQLKSSLPIKEVVKNQTMVSNGKEYSFVKENCYFRIGCKKLISDLISWGCVEDKTKQLSKVPDINKNYLKYFLLGFYDVDGIASVGEKAYIGFCGTEKMMESISLTLNKELNLKIKKPYYNKSNHIYYLQYGTNDEIENLFNYFYKDLEIPHLVRKEEKIKNYLNANTEIT